MGSFLVLVVTCSFSLVLNFHLLLYSQVSFIISDVAVKV